MKGDFSRVTFDPSKHFLRVLMQQGRVQLDADWNEQIAILLHYLQTLATDIIGPFAGPGDRLETEDDPNSRVLEKRCGFEIITAPLRIDKFLELSPAEKNRLKSLLSRQETRFLIGRGRYYVDGVLCTNHDYTAYNEQPDYPEAPAPTQKPYLVYLDVWERHVTIVEDPGLREVALGGPDTASRSKIVCQVKFDSTLPNIISAASSLTAAGPIEWSCASVKEHWKKWVEKWQPAQRGTLKARTKTSSKPDTDPCTIAPSSRYRGAENQLYRVEVHKPGTAHVATFKWSRENGAVIFPVKEVSISDGVTTVTLAHLGRDGRFGLAPGDWVELVNDNYVLKESTAPLLKVTNLDYAALQVTLEGTTDLEFDEDRHPLLRRWDHKEGNPARGGVKLENDGAILIKEGTGENEWFNLEDGIQIQFQPGATRYRTGDYWLIPARTATGEIEWPTELEDPNDHESALVPTAQAPHGVTHHYAPLAIIDSSNTAHDCTCCFGNLSICEDDSGSDSPIELRGMVEPAFEAGVAPQAEPVAPMEPEPKPRPRTKPKPRPES